MTMPTLTYYRTRKRPTRTHAADRMYFTTLCGIYLDPGHTIPRVVEVDPPTVYDDLCRTCRRVANTRDLAPLGQTADERRVLRASAIPGQIREIKARVFRVPGSADFYTVTVPTGSGLPVTCTCMDGKTHPETFCKHASAVLLEIGRAA